MYRYDDLYDDDLYSYSPPPRRTRRRRRRSPLPKLLAMGGVLILAVVLLPRFFPSNQTPSGSNLDGQLTNEIRQLVQEHPEAQPLLDQPNQYPQELLNLAVRNPEALDFVLNYPEKKNQAAAQDVGDVTQGQYPLLLQWDERWGYQTYGDGLMALTGCGPTVVSMAVCGLTGDNTVTPWTVAQYADKAGYYVAGTGSSWDVIREGCRAFGLEARELPLDKGVILQALEQGQPIICSMGPGDFTTSGHFILLTGLEDGQIRLNDPNRPSNSQKLWDYDTLAPQINNLWGCFLAE